MQGVFIYIQNPIGQGTESAQRLRDADNMLRQYEQLGKITGQCAEAAILGASLGKALGIPATFRMLFFPVDASDEDHVYAVLYPMAGQGRTPVELDVTKPPNVSATPIDEMEVTA